MGAPLEETLRRLRDERDEADRRYNDALTALDRALTPAPKLPDAPPGYDESQITPLNDAWNILPAPPSTGGVAGRLRGLIWRTIAPYLQRQLTFNSRLVDHLNRNAVPQREAHRALQEVLAALNAQGAAHADFQLRLMLLLQQITAYVDTKDRDAGGAALVLNASLSAMADDLLKRWESLTTRVEARTAAITAEHENLRATVAVAQHAALTAKREIERIHTVPAGPLSDGAEPKPRRDAAAQADVSVAASAVHGALNAYKYVEFENQFRGSRELIRERLESYVRHFAGASDVLDVGCGRGEFLDLLNTRGIPARGVDVNHEMVEACRSRGLEASHGDAVSYLASIPDASLGGVFAAQVVEHLEPDYLLRFLELAFHKLSPGGRIVLETLNPACWLAFFESYIRDITHRWPLHPDTLKYFVLASGFTSAEIEWRSPVEPHHRLQSIAISSDAAAPLADLVAVFNENVGKLNARIFTHMDYAVLGRR